MTRPGILPVLAGVNLLLALLLAALWLTPQGQLRGVRWPVPAAIAPQLGGAGQADLPPPPMASASRFLATLERPLFAPNRRPAPVAAAQAAESESDPLADIQLQGLYTGAGGGIFARVQGKNLRVPVGGKLGGWVVKGISDREVTLARGTQQHTLRLVPAKLSRLAPQPAKDTASAPAPSAATPTPAAAPSQASDPALRQEQERQERQRARLELMNARRIQNGLPPLPQ